MTEILGFLAAPIIMCFLLAGIHCYLGLHVLARGVIFVDLSLAQIAALGMTIAALAGYDAGTSHSYLAALTSTFIVSWIFTQARKREQDLPQEAIIGTVYAFGAGAAVLVIDRMSHGSEQIKQLLIGNILWVTWSQVAMTAAVYGAVGLVHWIFRRRFFEASFGRRKSGAGDFLFYALFGVVITSSVRISGVLQVFAYLIVPALVSGALFKNITHRLVFGWILGGVVSAAAMIGSYFLDVPSGAFVVVCFTILPLALLLFPKKMFVKTSVSPLRPLRSPSL